MAVVYRATGEVEHRPIGHKYTLKDLQQAVGGYIEAVPGSKARAYCNEEGLLLKLPYNVEASARFGIPLVGDVIELEKGDKQ